MTRRVPVIITLAAALGLCATASAETITTIAQVQALAEGDYAQSMPFCLTGLVTKVTTKGNGNRFCLLESADGGCLVRFSDENVKTGCTIRAYGHTEIDSFAADPILVDGSLYAFLGKSIREIDPATGAERRKKMFETRQRCDFGVASGSALVTPDRFVVGSLFTGCVAISRKTLDVEWATDFGAGLIATTAYVGPGNKSGNNSPIRLSNGLLCAPAVDGAVHFFDERDGKEVRKIECGVPYLAGAVETPSGAVVVADFGGHVRAYGV